MDSYTTTPDRLNLIEYLEKIEEVSPSLCGWYCFKTENCHYFSIGNNECRLFNSREVKPIEKEEGIIKIFTMELKTDTGMCIKTNVYDSCMVPDCQADEYKFENQCLYLNPDLTPIPDAGEICKKRNQTLATVLTKKNALFLFSKLNVTRPEFLLIGLNDRKVENQWVWDGAGKIEKQPLWDEKEPNGIHTNEDYTAIISKGLLVDIGVPYTIPFACGSKSYIYLQH